MRNAFHQASIAQKRIGIMVNNGKFIAVKFSREQFFAQCQTNGIRNALTQWSCGGFHTNGQTKFRMSSGFAVELAEVLQVVEAQRIARQMQQAVQQH